MHSSRSAVGAVAVIAVAVVCVASLTLSQAAAASVSTATGAALPRVPVRDMPRLQFHGANSPVPDRPSAGWTLIGTHTGGLAGQGVAVARLFVRGVSAWELKSPPAEADAAPLAR